jgi:hypothetical protein
MKAGSGGGHEGHGCKSNQAHASRNGCLTDDRLMDYRLSPNCRVRESIAMSQNLNSVDQDSGAFRDSKTVLRVRAVSQTSLKYYAINGSRLDLVVSEHSFKTRLTPSHSEPLRRHQALCDFPRP